MQIQAQDKIVNPDISYAGTPRTLKIGGINVSGVEGYEDYVLTGISGLSVGDEITVPGDEITNAVKRYWKHGLFSKVAIAADSIVGEKLYLHIYLAVRPRISNINYVGLKRASVKIWSRSWYGKGHSGNSEYARPCQDSCQEVFR